MVAGASTGVDGAIFIGYHAQAGTENAILDHTWSSKLVTNLWLNDLLVGEIGLNAAMCGHFDVPVVMVAGDQAVCREATTLLGNIETVAVKEATGRMAAHCLAPEVAQEQIREAVSRAVGRLQGGDAPEPLRISTPVSLTIELPKSDMAEKAAILPGAQREERRVTFTAEDMMEAFRAMRSMLALAG
jgi:D-amino peptidase